MLPYRVVCGQLCHLPVELEHRAWWAIRILNYELNATGEERKLNLNELRSYWIGPFVIVRVFPHGAVEIKDPTNDQVYKVTGKD